MYPSHELEDEKGIVECRKHSVHSRFRSSFHAPVLSAIVNNMINTIYVWHLTLRYGFKMG